MNSVSEFIQSKYMVYPSALPTLGILLCAISFLVVTSRLLLSLYILCCCYETETDTETETEIHDITEPKPIVKKRRTIADMPRLFVAGQSIRHTISHTWVGEYDAERNQIVCDDIVYSSLGNFASQHYKSKGQSIGRVDGWNECECEYDGEWISAADVEESDEE